MSKPKLSYDPPTLKSSEQWYKKWQKERGLIIIDPDGWERNDDNFSDLWYNKPITEREFSERVQESSIIICNPTITKEVEEDETK